MSLRRSGPVLPVGRVGAGALSMCLDALAGTDYPSRWFPSNPPDAGPTTGPETSRRQYVSHLIDVDSVAAVQRNRHRQSQPLSLKSVTRWLSMANRESGRMACGASKVPEPTRVHPGPHRPDLSAARRVTLPRRGGRRRRLGPSPPRAAARQEQRRNPAPQDRNPSRPRRRIPSARPDSASIRGARG